MTDYPKFKAAAVQAAPVFLDAEATADKACKLIEKAKIRRGETDWFPGRIYFRISVVGMADGSDHRITVKKRN